ncbi:MAG: hypothetical protein ACJAT2_002225 [Bacteriovoracaceae bacterium]|jgi:hypothetical protein
MIAILLLTVSALAATPYLYGEGELGGKSHSDELKRKIEDSLLTDGDIDYVKLYSKMVFLKAKMAQYENDVYQNLFMRSIEDHHLTRKQAEKKAKKRITSNRRTLLAFDEALSLLDQIKDYTLDGGSVNDPAIKNKIAKYGIYLSLIDTYFQEDVDRDMVDQIRNFSKLFYKFKRKNIDKDEASNLPSSSGEGFMSQKEIKGLQSSGVDISTIDPPSSAFWEKNNVEEFDPNDETWKGHVLFQPKDQEQVLHYKRMADGTIKIKAYWLNKENEEVDVTIRMSKEIHSGTLAGLLVRSLGYYATPTVFRKNVKLKLGKTTYEEFLSHLDKNHSGEMTDISNFVTSYNEEENSVMLRYIALEAYPTKDFYRKMGPFRTGRNGYDNRREYRALVMTGALLSLNDAKSRQTRADIFRDSKKAPWRPMIFLSDLGYSMGSYLVFDNLSSVNDYVTDTTHNRKKSVTVRWLNSYDYKNFEQTTYSDARWWIRRARKLTSPKIYQMALNAGYPEPVARLYGKKVADRINNYIEAFYLKDEIGLIETESYEEIHKDFPKYVNKKGKIQALIDQEDNSNISHVAYFGLWHEGLSMAGATAAAYIINGATELSLNQIGLVNTSFSLGEGVLDFDVKYKKNRTFEINKNKSKDQKRLIVKDTYTLSIPVGSLNGSILNQDVGVTLPLNFKYEYEFTHYHTYDTVKEAFKADFFKSFNPRRLSTIAKNLKKGEQVKLSKRHSFDIGSFKADVTDYASVNLSILGHSNSKLSEVLLTKTDDHLELSSSKVKSGSWRTGFDIKAILKLGLGASRTKRMEQFELNRVRLSDLDEGIEEVDLNNAFRVAFEKGDFKKIRKYSKNVKIDIKSKVKNWHAGLFWWSKYSTSDFIEYDVKSDIEKKLNRKAFVARQYKSTTRDFGKFYVEDFDFGSLEFVVDFGGTRINESKVMGTSLEVVLSKDEKSIDDMLLNITVVKNDNHATKKEMKREHLDYFSDLVGEEDYFNYQIPEEVKYYSPLTTTQYWQVSKKGLKKFVEKFSKSKRCKKTCKEESAQIAILENSLEKANEEDLKPIVKSIMAAYIGLIERAIGKRNKRLSSLREYISKKHYFIYTKLSNVNKYTVPMSFTKEMDLYGKPLGRYQGPSFLQKFKRSHYLKHIIDVETTLPSL